MTLLPYTSVEIRENDEPLVDLSKAGFLVEPMYFKQGYAEDSRLFLREGIAHKLLKVQESLGDFRLKVWDGFRPKEVQDGIYQEFWAEQELAHPDWDEEKLKLEVGKFVSPAYQVDRIPPHLTGGAVDLTLVDKEGNELDMGTEFDHFGPEAALFYFNENGGNMEAARNRKILGDAMEAEGFTADGDEWWHFDWGDQMWAFKRGEPFAFYGEASL